VMVIAISGRGSLKFVRGLDWYWMGVILRESTSELSYALVTLRDV
jgi:hypothetical protein